MLVQRMLLCTRRALHAAGPAPLERLDGEKEDSIRGCEETILTLTVWRVCPVCAASRAPEFI